MKHVVLAIAVALSVIAASCLVDRRSDGLTCSQTTDCDGARICDEGYCIDDPCPAACNAGCNPQTGDCQIVCNAITECGTVECPEDFDCAITCDGPGACGTVTCSGNADCTITCVTSDSCGSISCGNGSCDVTCSDLDSCGSISCSRSCACDVECPAGNCGGQSCSSNGNCVDADTGECSSAMGNCDRC